jgi:hypothetical protein
MVTCYAASWSYCKSCMKWLRPSDATNTTITVIGMKKYCKSCYPFIYSRPVKDSAAIGWLSTG